MLCLACVLPLAALVLSTIDVSGWSAPSCPAEPLLARVGSQLGAVTVRVSVRERGATLLGAIEVEREGKVRRREHEAASCEALIEALAIGVELAQRPVPQRTSPPPAPPVLAAPLPPPPTAASPPAPEPPPPEPASPEPVLAPPLPVSAVAPPAEPPAPVAPAQANETLPPAESPPPMVFELATRAALVLAPAPGPSFGAEVSGAWSPRRGSFRLELAATHARTATLSLGPARARFSLTTARLSACSPSLTLGPASGALCGGVAGGALWAQGLASSSISAPTEVLLPWVDVTAQARLAVALPLGLQLEAHAGPTLPVTRHTFVFDQPRVTVHQVPVVGFEGGVGLGHAW